MQWKPAETHIAVCCPLDSWFRTYYMSRGRYNATLRGSRTASTALCRASRPLAFTALRSEGGTPLHGSRPASAGIFPAPLPPASTATCPRDGTPPRWPRPTPTGVCSDPPTSRIHCIISCSSVPSFESNPVSWSRRCPHTPVEAGRGPRSGVLSFGHIAEDRRSWSRTRFSGSRPRPTS